ncbi:MAG: histidinol phosphate phosphatase domain-containing protein [Deltaproteobacteria bacterium]|nr:histidinol phosphate phosphatase domain-containing protein [Candidatus Anaeroferrophillus wilburensis]MBN2889494.1 histidinol phosphate phosphatase domain-containing protein [Deltaproteobacteria bacterium]
MIDLHTHTLFSDGVLLPAELARRAQVLGYRALAFTDHVDSSNLDWVVPKIVAVCADLQPEMSITLIPGVEITHVPPALISRLVDQARDLGARIVVVHGETITEPVCPGTNKAAVESGIDILAHPGLISRSVAELAASRGVCLEITTRKGHSIANGHVARLAREVGAPLVLDNDAHAPGDLVSLEFASQVALGAGLSEAEWQEMRSMAQKLVDRAVSAAD